MGDKRCPVCFGPFEVREVAPCMGCGHLPEEIEHFNDGRHTYDEMEVIHGLCLVLCDSCCVDFGSYDPEFFGLPRDQRIGYGRMRIIKRLKKTSLGKDKYCPTCNGRLAFLRFVAAVRSRSIV